MNFDKMNENKKSSIKCHFPPGGTGNFSLGWGNDEMPKRVRTHQRSDSNSDFNIITGEGFINQSVKVVDKENYNIMNEKNTQNSNVSVGKILPCLNRDSKSESIKTKYETGKNQFNIFNENTAGNTDKSSIKVAYAPGGKSNFNFGDDKSSYEEYRKKR
jgi:hypothetical protein